VTPFYLYVPAVVLAVWLGHAVWSWTRPHRRDPFGVLLLAGLPVATLVAFVTFALVHDPERGQYDALPRGDHGDLRVRLLVVVLELVAAGVVVLALEGVLAAVRTSRRRRVGSAPPVRVPEGS